MQPLHSPTGHGPGAPHRTGRAKVGSATLVYDARPRRGQRRGVRRHSRRAGAAPPAGRSRSPPTSSLAHKIGVSEAVDGLDAMAAPGGRGRRRPGRDHKPERGPRAVRDARALTWRPPRRILGRMPRPAKPRSRAPSARIRPPSRCPAVRGGPPRVARRYHPGAQRPAARTRRRTAGSTPIVLCSARCARRPQRFPVGRTTPRTAGGVLLWSVARPPRLEVHLRVAAPCFWCRRARSTCASRATARAASRKKAPGYKSARDVNDWLDKHAPRWRVPAERAPSFVVGIREHNGWEGENWTYWLPLASGAGHPRTGHGRSRGARGAMCATPVLSAVVGRVRLVAPRAALCAQWQARYIAGPRASAMAFQNWAGNSAQDIAALVADARERRILRWRKERRRAQPGHVEARISLHGEDGRSCGASASLDAAGALPRWRRDRSDRQARRHPHHDRAVPSAAARLRCARTATATGTSRRRPALAHSGAVGGARDTLD